MNRIKECRIAHNMSQKEVAIELKVTPSSISQWEAGGKNLSADHLEELSDLFGVTMDYLYGRNPENADLTMGEAEMLSVYRQLNQKGKDMVGKLMMTFLEDPDYRQERSVNVAK